MMTATERAYAFTKRRILDGRFVGGALISEADVAEGVRLSRTPVREAFVRLESEGLLRLYPKRGALVVPVSAEEVESVMETRVLVERHAIAKVIRTGAEVRPRLDRAIARQEDLAARDATPVFVEADRGFHRIYVAAAGNPILLALYDSLRDRQSRMGLVAIARDDDRTRQILDEHRALVRAVGARDEAGALAVLEGHLGTTLALLRAAPGEPSDD
jgi:DNA-binding GntR family transcriptional regulator